VNRDSPAVFGDDLLRLRIDTLAYFAGECFAQSAFARDVRGYLDGRPVGEWVQAEISNARETSELDMKSAGQEERRERQAYGEPFSSGQEIES
jgi:hypothetical protein